MMLITQFLGFVRVSVSVCVCVCVSFPMILTWNFDLLQHGVCFVCFSGSFRCFLSVFHISTKKKKKKKKKKEKRCTKRIKIRVRFS